MARSPRITARPLKETVLRLAEPELDALVKLVSRRYPDYEWATFVRLGWRDTSKMLALTLASIEAPTAGDLDESVGHVAIDESYTLRMALAAEKHPLAVGVVHSHPQDCPPRPSVVDDDMDTYYARYFGDFAPGRPYVSLILSLTRIIHEGADCSDSGGDRSVKPRCQGSATRRRPARRGI
jgi:proteasome lid subunit RPN8/RPN11